MPIRYEQAVYGSFPFWDRGYAVLAKSAGCRSEWLDALRLAGQRYGEPPTGVAEHPGLFVLALRHGIWMVVGAFPDRVRRPRPAGCSRIPRAIHESLDVPQIRL